MSTRARLKTVVSFAGIAATSLGLVCSDSPSSRCPVEELQYWSYLGYNTDVSYPQCPVPAGGSAPFSVYFAFTTTRPANIGTDGRSNTLVTQFYNQNFALIALPYYGDWDVNPFNSSQIYTQAEGSYPAGSVGSWGQFGNDWAEQSHYSGSYSEYFAMGRVKLAWKKGVALASRAGPTVVNLGQSYSWTDSLCGATSSISSHAWYANGAQITTATGPTLSYTPLSPGQLDLQHRVDEVAGYWDTLTVPVTVQYSVTVSGPSPVRRTTACSYRYTASAIGGAAPLTRQWQLNGVNVGGNQSYYDATFGTSGTFDLRVTLTDNVGNVATAVKWVTVNTTAPMCAL